MEQLTFRMPESETLEVLESSEGGQKNIVEHAREKAVKSLFDMNTFDESFEVWKKDIEEQVGENPSFHALLTLGDSLGDIFQQTGDSGRSQSTVAAGGAAWEGLVCWYMNLCLVGTRAVVVKHKKSLIPDPVAQAITVNYGSFKSNSESDLVAIIFPDESEVNEPREEDFDFKDTIDDLCRKYFEDVEVGIIQCKTNWKDNAQIPMLWEMIYSSKGFEDDITIGTSAYSMKDFDDFFYAFVTVPTTSDEYKPDGVNVKRVQNLSGGNYWGRPSKDGVGQSLKEIFNGNFDYAVKPKSQRERVQAVLESEQDLSYFRLDVI